MTTPLAGLRRRWPALLAAAGIAAAAIAGALLTQPAALAGTESRMRAVLVLRYTEDLSETATAELLGCSVHTVRSQTVRGLARLRALLGAVAPSTVLEEC